MGISSTFYAGAGLSIAMFYNSAYPDKISL